MKKVLFLLVACAMTIGFISCANTGENTAAAGDDKANTENVEQKVDMNEIIAKAKAEGANWTVDQWKDAFKSMLIAAKPMFDLMKEMKEKTEANPDSALSMLADLETKAKEFEPIEKGMSEFEEVAKATENGKKVLDDEAWGKQIMKELGYPDDL